MSKFAIALGAILLVAAAPPKLDPDTAAWWATTAQLSNDGMEGRDTGSPAFEHAAQLVASKFAAAGLKPAGRMAAGSSAFRCTRWRSCGRRSASAIARCDFCMT